MSAVPDWTQGADAILYQCCSNCAHVQYFERAFCERCGAPNPETHQASGKGVVYAVSRVHRAPTPETRAHGPYNIVLVDMAEGFRMMAHGASDLSIGDAVSAQFRTFVGTRVPYFTRTSS